MKNKKKIEMINSQAYMFELAKCSQEELFEQLETSAEGKDENQVARALDKYGINEITHGKKIPLIKQLFDAIINPFTIILIVLAVVSLLTDVIFVSKVDRDFSTVITITVLVLFSGIQRFIQENNSDKAVDELSRIIHTTTSVKRLETDKAEINMEDVVVGDIVYLSAGDMIPADSRILEAKDLFISQAALTGESEPVEKYNTLSDKASTITDISNIAFMGTNVISGSGKTVVIATGNDTMLGGIAKALGKKPPKTTFEKGVNSVSWLLIRLMLIMVPTVLLINGITKGNWLNATLFAISLAVGLTPEMLPMIITTSLAKGASVMSKEKVIIKNLNSIQNLGSIDILCTDKTGTLTQDKVVLEYYLDLQGKESNKVLKHAFLNSYYQTGLKNLIDVAIISKQKDINANEEYRKVDEIPFDFVRRRMSVVVEDKQGKTQLITKGAVEEILECCSYAELNGEAVLLDEKIRNDILEKQQQLNYQGVRVIALAQKTNPAPVGQFSVSDEHNMVLIGLLGFLDPPKETAAQAISALDNYGVKVKVLTGDSEKVTRSICNQVGINSDKILLGSEVDQMNDEQLKLLIENVDVFAKLSPFQKARIITTIKENGHVCGYMGDGINDANAMKVSDVGISVDTAVDIAKESADVILLEKDLMVLEQGIIEGRTTYANMIKYVKMTVSSNFGNILSIVIASAFLPFLPMEAIHLLLLNLIYDISCTTIPWDNVDNDFLKKPRKWEADSISKYMLWLGPVSSIFDVLTFILMYFVICPMFTNGQLYTQLADPSARLLYIALFQTGWFIESIWSQTLVIHMIRTDKIPFIQSNAAKKVTIVTLCSIIVSTILTYTDFGRYLGFQRLPMIYYGYLLVIVMIYALVATLIKFVYIKKYKEWL